MLQTIMPYRRIHPMGTLDAFPSTFVIVIFDELNIYLFINGRASPATHKDASAFSGVGKWTVDAESKWGNSGWQIIIGEREGRKEEIEGNQHPQNV